MIPRLWRRGGPDLAGAAFAVTELETGAFVGVGSGDVAGAAFGALVGRPRSLAGRRNPRLISSS